MINVPHFAKIRLSVVELNRIIKSEFGAVS